MATATSSFGRAQRHRQKKSGGIRKGKRGITLIMVAGVLAILAAIGAGFFSIVSMQGRSASRYSDAVRAELLAKAGIEDAIGRLRAQAFIDTESPSAPWYTVDYLHGLRMRVSFAADLSHNDADDDGDGTIDNESERSMPFTRALSNTAGKHSDSFTLNIEDAAGKINLNACDNLGVVLDNLCRVIGSPLVAAETDALQPRRWGSAPLGEGGPPSFDTNPDDKPENTDIRYWLYDGDKMVWNGRDALKEDGRPKLRADGRPLYGDGYAIAGFRARRGPFKTLAELKEAIPFVDVDGDGKCQHALERLEVDVKFTALKPFVTIQSWVDTNTACTGKFEWVAESSINGEYYQVLTDRDKSWVRDDIKADPLNHRGSLRGCYVSIVNGHGAGQLRRIATNGADWIGIRVDEKMEVEPGPISSYMIVAPEAAVLEDLNGATFDGFPEKLPPSGRVWLPKLNVDGTLVANQKIDYLRHPLCIHRAPVNINTASDKVLASLFLGISVQHGHPMAVGTDADPHELRTVWRKKDPHELEPSIQTLKGLKRVPAASGRPVFNRPMPQKPAGTDYDFAYLNNYGTVDPAGSDKINEAQELAFRIILARQKDASNAFINPMSLEVMAKGGTGLIERGPFRSWDDVFFRVVRPWDEARLKTGWKDTNGNNAMDGEDEYHATSVARLVMANANPNTALLKFNPNIEFIDRWGRNFTEMEPVMVYTNQAEPHASNPPVASPMTDASIPIFTTADPLLKSSQRNAAGQFIKGAYITRNYRTKSDELIDKSDLNVSTTECSFDSNGLFSITSIGQIRSNTGGLMSERKIEAVVKVYDVWRESTQRQFVQGRISKAVGKPGSNASGQVARDGYNKTDRLALNTLPEPLVPLGYTIRDQNGQANARNKEVVDKSAGGTSKRNAFGQTVDIQTPDVLANRVLPAGYDGQIVLATNTSSYDTAKDKDTFLASFDGDLDTATCAGNGHEQAKVPSIDAGAMKGRGNEVRVVDTIGLLGAMNDGLADIDPGLPLVNPADTVNGYRWVYRFKGVSAGLKPLDPKHYWNNVTMRMGDLRTDGVYLSAPGVSGNDATLKYLIGAGKENFDPASRTGNTVTLWFKPTWRHDDFRTHEFFNASNPGRAVQHSRGCYLSKYGQYIYSYGDGPENPTHGHSAHRTKTNDLVAFWEGNNDWDLGGLLHGGYDYVPKALEGESPSFRIQPFRWHFAGMRRNYWSSSTTPVGDGPTGHWISSDDYKNSKNISTIENHIRPFIGSQLHPEGEKTWKPDQFWVFRTSGAAMSGQSAIGNSGAVAADGSTGQDVKWQWADPPGPNQEKCFSINNLNFGNQGATTDPNEVITHYRFMPDDGTFAVIDELKLSNLDQGLKGLTNWSEDRVVREQATSRYYLPSDVKSRAEADAGGPPTFTSQTLLQSERGFDATKAAEPVTVVRVSWTVFTPRFLHEYTKQTGRFNRFEKLTYNRTAQQRVKMPFFGPFDFEAYNDDAYNDDTALDGNDRQKTHISVNRPDPSAYGKNPMHASRGVEIELLDSDEYGGGKVLGKTFTNPSELNAVSASKPIQVAPDKLRYRVRFRYPVDPLVDPNLAAMDDEGRPCVDPAEHAMLDTPVFDDISVTYFSKPRVYSYREVME